MTEGITINSLFIKCDPSKVSDGYHTFEELYDHRCLLFIHLLQIHQNLSFASYFHDDGTTWDGWFVAGCKLDGGIITYHLPEKFAELIPSFLWIEKAPLWDGHTSKDVCDRLIEEAKIQNAIADQPASSPLLKMSDIENSGWFKFLTKFVYPNAIGQKK